MYFEKFPRLLLALAVPVIAFGIVATPTVAQMRVGVGKVDITPEPKMLPKPFTSIHDHIYTRAIMIENGGSSALLMNLDVAAASADFFAKVIPEVSQQEGVPENNILVSVTHDHSTPSAGEGGQRDAEPLNAAFIDATDKAVQEAARQAKTSLQPAEMSFGEGNVYLNANRDAIDPVTRLWAQEPNLDFPSDKTLAVLEFRKPNGGAPIAIYMNYASHDLLFLTNEVSGGFMGAGERYLENNFDDKVVAVWSSGAAGDQNPLYMRVVTAISRARVRQEMDPSKVGNDPGGAEENAAIGRAMFGNNKRPVLPLDPKVEKQGWDLTDAMGQIMGEEALRVISEMKHFTSDPVMQGSSAVVTCPGRDRLDHNREGVEGTYKDGAPVVITVGAIRLGDVALGRVNAEIFNKIGQEVKSDSPFRHTIFVTWTDGRANSGYIPADDAFGQLTFQVIGTRLKPGCAERAIVDGIDGLLYEDIQNSGLK